MEPLPRTWSYCCRASRTRANNVPIRFCVRKLYCDSSGIYLCKIYPRVKDLIRVECKNYNLKDSQTGGIIHSLTRTFIIILRHTPMDGSDWKSSCIVQSKRKSKLKGKLVKIKMKQNWNQIEIFNYFIHTWLLLLVFSLNHYF